MSGSTNETARLTPGLRAFVASPGEDEPWPERAGGEYLASRELFVEEQLLGQRTSRFVSEGGVRLKAGCSRRRKARRASRGAR